MKGFRGTIVFAVFVAAVVGLAVWQYKRSIRTAKQKTVNAKLFHAMKSDNVVELDMTSSKGTYTVKKQGSKWHVVAPFSDAANGDAVQSDLSSIFGQSVVSAENGNAAVDWSKFGLVAPDYTLELHFADGKTQSIKVGRVRTYDDGYYLRRNNEMTLLVGNRGWDTILDKNADDFRYMKPEIPSADLTALKIRSLRKGKQFDYSIVDEKGNWVDSKNPEIKLSKNKVNLLINSIRDLVGDTVASDTKTPADIRKFRLERPEIEIEAAYEKPAKVLHKISISSVKNGQVNWYSSDNPAIYEMDSTKTKAILKTIDDLRDLKYVFKFDPDQVAHIDYKRVVDASTGHVGAKPVKPVHIVLDKVDGTWKLHTPNTKKLVNQQGVKDFLAYLRGLRAEKFLNYRVPVALRENEVVLKDGSGKVLYHLQFGGSITNRLNKKAKIEYYAVKSNASKEFFAVTKATLDELVNKNMVENKPSFLLPNKNSSAPAGAKSAIGRVQETKVVKGKK